MIQHQQSLSAADTIAAKLRMERDARLDGVIIQNYHADHGVFDSKALMEELANSKQGIRFSAPGAAHSNGVSERGIQHVTAMARTILLHAALRSPVGTITVDLRPMSMDYAVDLESNSWSRQRWFIPIGTMDQNHQ